MNKQHLRIELDTTLTALYDLFSAIPVETINTVPFPGSWTPAQLVRHLVMANGGCLEEINGPVQDTVRPVDAGVEDIRTAFLDFSTRMEAPGFVAPPAMPYEKEPLLVALREIRSGLLTAVDTLDLSPTCLLFELPVLGYLTRWEVLHFVLYHTRRHAVQLRKMSESIMDKVRR